MVQHLILKDNLVRTVVILFILTYAVPLVFTEKTDIKIDIAAGGTVGAGATFDIILVDNPA